MRRLPVLVVTAGALLAVCGCALAPKYTRPEAPIPPALPGETASEAGFPAVPDVPWQEFIGEPRLRSVLELVLAGNRDLRTAALNAEAVGAQYRIRRAELYPSVGASATLDVTHVPEKLSPTGKSSTSDTYSVSGFTSWELDLFGRIRNLKERAFNEFLASQQVAMATRTSLIATTAATYLALAADSENLILATSTLETQQRSLELIRRSREAGIASELDVQQAQSQVESARFQEARYAGLVELDRHALDQLAGAPVPLQLLPEGLDNVEPLKPLSAGVSSEVLLRRPDVLAAEYQLKAANANIGAARAAYFPRISLTGALGLASPALADLFDGSTWNFTPKIVAPIFTGGARKATAEAARLSRDAAISQYEGVIQAAFREASDALSLRRTLAGQVQAGESLVHALQRTYELSEARYRSGIDGYLGVLVAQRELFQAQQTLVGVRLQEQQNRVDLYRVLGGGV
ncbi:MAG: efflux transporter outer membrane subunit [Gemmatimonadales bacterium]|nr:efflux transporter outer membrane subunit [Gemmatimonadales bacterium]